MTTIFHPVTTLAKSVRRLLWRFRHPVSLPEEIADALGIELSNNLALSELIRKVQAPECLPQRLRRFMPREEAEAAFKMAARRESFRYSSLYSYYFSGGWVEFSLHFDEWGRLRRLYVIHKEIEEEGGMEMPLTT